MGAIEDIKSVQSSLSYGLDMLKNSKSLGNMRENLVLAFKLISLNIDEYDTTHDFNRLVANMAYTAAYMKKLDVITGEAMVRTIWIGVQNQIEMIVSTYASSTTRRAVSDLLVENPPHVEETTRGNPIKTLSGVRIIMLNGDEHTGTITIDTSKGTSTANITGLPFFPVRRNYNTDDQTFNQTGW
jgi:hypothetical protein